MGKFAGALVEAFSSPRCRPVESVSLIVSPGDLLAVLVIGERPPVVVLIILCIVCGHWLNRLGCLRIGWNSSYAARSAVVFSVETLRPIARRPGQARYRTRRNPPARSVLRGGCGFRRTSRSRAGPQLSRSVIYMQPLSASAHRQLFPCKEESPILTQSDLANGLTPLAILSRA